jgi:hypothetical protein
MMIHIRRDSKGVNKEKKLKYTTSQTIFKDVCLHFAVKSRSKYLNLAIFYTDRKTSETFS